MQRLFIQAALAAATISIAAFSPAIAEEKTADDTFVQQLYGREPGKGLTHACFVRQYDFAHFAKHPKQKVSEMKLLVTAEILPEDDKPNHAFNMDLRYKTRAGTFDTGGECGHVKIGEAENNEPRLGCGVDCDGGGLSMALAPDNKSVTVSLERVRIWRKTKPGASTAIEEEDLELKGGADDRKFKLYRADLSQCAALIRERKELVALRDK
ncbi:MAG TPA: hypothetical protein VM867_02445 [Xanthobacteraceae bacterium]|jgi:hypothetical protein|nr:hypothetical protein [Xanthobacteraceae bacterium]